jgi:hypothetical protein
MTTQVRHNPRISPDGYASVLSEPEVIGDLVRKYRLMPGRS